MTPQPTPDSPQLRARGRDEQVLGGALRLLLLALLLALWTLNEGALAAAPFFALWGALLALTAALWWRLQRPPASPAQLRGWAGAGLGLETLLVVGALLLDRSARSDWYLLWLLVGCRVALLYGDWPGARWLPVAFAPLYALTVALRAGTVATLAEPLVLGRAALLAGVGVAVATLARTLWVARSRSLALALRLRRRNADLDTRTQVLTQTATNLASSVLELRSLQQGIRAINASLDLNKLLALVEENVAAVFGGASCAIGLRDPDGTVRVSARSGSGDAAPLSAGALAALAEQVVLRHQPALLAHGDEGQDRLIAAMAVPMVVDGEAIGALLATRASYTPFTPDDQQRLTAFADQAALAVKNSRLYEQVERLYQEVKERSAELEAVLDSIGDGVIVTEPDGAIRLTNPVANIILGLPDEVPPHTPLPPVVLDGGFDAHLRATLDNRSGDPVLGELKVLGATLQGQRTYQALSALLGDIEAEPRGVVTVLRDITATKELEQLKNNFVSTVSHELKTPLHSIRGFVNIILAEKSTGPLNEVQRDFLTTVQEQATRLERLILDLLEFNRLESGQIKLHPEPLDLSFMAEAMVEQLRPVAREASVTLLCDIDSALPAEGDRLRIEQVFHNLIANAVKFTPQGGRVRVRGRLVADTVEVVVEDTGIGIPRDAQERIFERFFQVDASQTRAYGGAGLGLAICKHIIERHGGRIWAESEPGRGSRFHFVLPRELASAMPLTVDFSRLEAG